MNVRRIGRGVLSGLVSAALLAGSLAVAERLGGGPTAAEAAPTPPPPSAGPPAVGVPSPLPAGGVSTGEVVPDRKADPKVLQKTPVDLPPSEPWVDRRDREAKARVVVKGFDPATSVEDPTQRTRTGAVFKNADGTFTARIAKEPVHYQTPTGKWEKIDARVLEDKAHLGEFVTAASSVTARFSSRGVEMKGERGSHVEWKPRGLTLGTPVVAADGLSVTYPDVWPNVDLKFILLTNGVKEQIVVKGPTSFASFPFDVTGLTVNVDAKGKPSTPDAEFAIGDIEIQDSRGAPVNSDEAKGAAKKLDSTGLAVEVDPVWLASQTSFPIVIDPTLTVGSYYNEAWNSNGGFHCGSATVACGQIFVGNSRAGGPVTPDTVWRDYATYQYSQILPTASVQSTLVEAHFDLSYVSGTGTTQQVAARRAVAYAYCGINANNDCGQPLLSPAGSTVIGTGTAVLPVTNVLQPFWTPGAVNVGWGFNGDELSAYTFKGVSASLSITYQRNPIVPQTSASPVNGYTQHQHLNGVQLSIPAQSNPDGPTVYYRFVLCSTPSWATCGVILDSGFTTSPSYTYGLGVGLPASFYNTQYYWGVATSTAPTGTGQDWYSGWLNSWKLYNNAPPDPQLIAPADGFRWAPNAPPVFTISRGADPDGDAVQYRLVVREPGSSGAVWRSDWSGLATGTGNLDFTIPSTAPLKAGQQYEWTTELQDGIVYFHWYFYRGEPQAAATTYRSTRFEQRLGTSGPSPFQTLGPVTANLATGNVATGISTVGYEALGGTIGGTFSYNSRAQDSGLRARFFNDANGNGQPDDALITQRTDREVRFSWANPSSVPGVNNFVGSWTGFFTPPATGTYQFAAAAGADDKVKIEVGTYVVQANQGASVSEIKLDSALTESVASFEARPNVSVTAGGIALTGGAPYPVKITYSNPSGPGALGFYMTAVNPTPSSVYSLVPASLLSPDAPILPAGWTFNHEEGFSATYSHVLVETSQIVVTRTDGEKLTYLKSSNGGYSPPPGEDDVVTIAAGVATITDTGGTVYKFRPDGQLDTITSPVDSATPAAAVPVWADVLLAGSPQPVSRLSSLTDPVSGRAVTFVYQGVGTCPTKAGYVNPGIGMLCQVNLPDGSSTKLFYLSPASGVFVLSRIEQPGDVSTGVPAVDYGYGANGLLSQVRDALVNEAIDTAQAGVNSTTDFTTNLGYDTINRVTSVQAPKAAPADTARQRVVMQYQGAIGTPTNETWVLVDGLEISADPNDWDRKVTFDQDARVLLDYQAVNATSGQSMRTETRWDTLNDRPLVNISNSQASTSIYNHRGELVTSYGPANQGCFDLTNTSPTYRLPNGTCTTPPVARTDFEFDTSLNTDGSSTPFTNLAVSLWPNNTMTGKPAAKTTGLGGTPATFVYNWAAGAPPGISAADFSFQATGEIRFPSAVPYTLEAVAGTDDVVNVYVDDQLIVSKPGGATAASGSYNVANNLSLTDGADHVRRVRVEFTDTSGNAALTLNWTPSGGAKVAIPVDRFRPRYSLQTRTTASTNSGVDAPAQVTHTSYDAPGVDPALGMITKVTEDPAGLKLATSTGYEAAGYRRRTSRTLPAGNTYTYEYTNATANPNNAAMNSPCTTADDTLVPQGGKLQYTTAPVAADGTAIRTLTVYDTLGRTVGILQGTRAGTVDTWEANWTCTSYDARQRVTQVTVPAFGTQTTARTVTTNYRVGNDPRTTSVADPAGTITTTVDLLGRVTTYTDIWNQTTTTVYDQTTGRVSSSSGPVGPQTFTYDRAGRVTAQTLDGVAVATPTYETAGTANEFALASVAYSNGTSVTNERNTIGTVNSLTWKQGATTLATDAVTKVQDGRTTGNTLTWAPTATAYAQKYRYDTVGRLTRATVPGSTIDYNYGSTPACTAAPSSGLNSNKASIVTTPTTGTATTQSFCYDAADRLASSTGVTTLAHDARGNVTTVNDDFYGFDGANRHTQTVNNNSGTGGAIPTHRATTAGSNAAGATSLTLTKPATAVAGDVLVASVAAADAGATTTTTYSEGFETGVGAWTSQVAAATLASSPDTARTGTKSLKLTPGGGQSNGRFFPPVTVGVPTTLAVWAKGTGSVQPYVQFFDANWTTLGSATTPSFTLSATAFTQWSSTYTAPAGTTIVQVAFQNFDVNPWYLDDVTVTTGGTAATSMTAPTGWSQATTKTITGVTLTTFVHAVAVADPASWAFTLSQSAKAAGTIGAYSGVDLASPIDATASGSNLSGTSHVAPSVTTTGVNRLGLSVTAANLVTSMSPPAGSTERADQAGGAGAPTVTIETSDFPQAAAGATATQTTVTATVGTSATATVTLRPAATAGTLPVHRATSPASNTTGGTSITITKPAATVAGDLLVASVAAADSSSATTTLYSEGFEAGVGAWTIWAAGPSVAASADTARTGTQSLKLTPGGGQSNGRFFPPVTAGVPATLTAYAKGTGSVQPYVQFYDSNWTYLGAATTPAFTLSPTAFTQWTSTYTAPAGTGIVQVAFQNFDVNPWYLDDVSLTTGGGNQATSVTAPTGWTTVTSNATAGVTLSTFTHTAAADPASWVFNLSQSVKAAGAISAYSGVDPVSPIDVSATGTNLAGTNHVAPSVTTTGANRLAVTITAATAATSMTPPVGSTERADQAGGAGAPTATVETSDFPQSAVGATGTKTTVTASAATSATATLTLRPVSGGGTTKVSYVRDATNRIVERKVNDVTVARYTFSSSGDTPDAELDGTNIVQRRTLGLMGGAVLSKAAGSEIWSISNLHGDTIATLSSTGVVTGGPFTYDPFGKTISGVPDNQIGLFDNGWLGQNQRPLEQQTGLRAVIEMGARVYDPQLGRFLQVDPIEGGTSNDYAYVNDPINAFDLTGTNCWGFCEAFKSTIDHMAAKAGSLGKAIFEAPGKAHTWAKKNRVYKNLAWRAYGIGLARGSAAGGFLLCGPGCAVAGGSIGGGYGGMVRYRVCGSGIITCRSGRDDAKGQLKATAIGAASGGFIGSEGGSIVKRVWKYLF